MIFVIGIVVIIAITVLAIEYYLAESADIFWERIKSEALSTSASTL